MTDKDAPALMTKEVHDDIFNPALKCLFVVDCWEKKFGRCRIMDLTKKIVEDKFESGMEK